MTNKQIRSALGWLILGGALCFFGMRIISFRDNAGVRSEVEYRPRIAIIAPASHPALEAVARGFRDSLSRVGDVHPEYIEYNAAGNRTLLRSYIEDALARPVDLIFAIATPAAQLAREITAKKNIKTPIVFGAVSDPVSVGIAAHADASGNNCTGVVDTVDHHRQLEVLRILKPKARSILFVYNPSAAGLEVVRKQVEEYGAQHDMQIQVASVYSTTEIARQVTPHLTSVDTVLVPLDNVVVSGIETLIKLCEQYGVTLYTSDLELVTSGAALGFGASYYDAGLLCGSKAHQILVDKKLPQDIVIERSCTERLRLNTAHAPKQGLIVDPNLIFLMQRGETVPSANSKGPL